MSVTPAEWPAFVANLPKLLRPQGCSAADIISHESNRLFVAFSVILTAPASAPPSLNDYDDPSWPHGLLAGILFFRESLAAHFTGPVFLRKSTPGFLRQHHVG